MKNNEVKETRSINTKFIFNMEAAMQALAATPAKSHRSGAFSELSSAIIDCCKQAGTPLAVNQITAMLAAGGMEVPSKKVSDKCWYLAGGVKDSDTPEQRAQKEEKASLVKLGGGMYKIKD